TAPSVTSIAAAKSPPSSSGPLGTPSRAKSWERFISSRGCRTKGSPARLYPRLVGFVPAPGPTGLDDERHRELAMRLAGAFHDASGCLCSCFDFALRNLEQELVVDLQQHAGTQLLAGECGGNTGHCALDDVGGRAL